MKYKKCFISLLMIVTLSISVAFVMLTNKKENPTSLCQTSYLSSILNIHVQEKRKSLSDVQDNYHLELEAVQNLKDKKEQLIQKKENKNE